MTACSFLTSMDISTRSLVPALARFGTKRPPVQIRPPPRQGNGRSQGIWWSAVCITRSRVSDFGSPLGASTGNGGPLGPRMAPSRCCDNFLCGFKGAPSARRTRHRQQWTPADADGRSFPGQACRRAGSPHRYLASGRRGRRLKCHLTAPVRIAYGDRHASDKTCV